LLERLPLFLRGSFWSEFFRPATSRLPRSRKAVVQLGVESLEDRNAPQNLAGLAQSALAGVAIAAMTPPAVVPSTPEPTPHQAEQPRPGQDLPRDAPDALALFGGWRDSLPQVPAELTAPASDDQPGDPGLSPFATTHRHQALGTEDDARSEGLGQKLAPTNEAAHALAGATGGGGGVTSAPQLASIELSQGVVGANAVLPSETLAALAC
jgi:hypothetical protein